jgi:hypothetical protein
MHVTASLVLKVDGWRRQTRLPEAGERLTRASRELLLKSRGGGGLRTSGGPFKTSGRVIVSPAQLEDGLFHGSFGVVVAILFTTHHRSTETKARPSPSRGVSERHFSSKWWRTRAATKNQLDVRQQQNQSNERRRTMSTCDSEGSYKPQVSGLCKDSRTEKPGISCRLAI